MNFESGFKNKVVAEQKQHVVSRKQLVVFEFK